MTDIELSIPSGAFSLRGTLTVAGTSPGPAALLISGSGPIDRDSNSKRLPIGVMGQIASLLAINGITSLRYDKRGVGGSDGDYHATGFQDNIADARAALEVLRARPEVDARRIVLIGHSEGALIASDLADDQQLAGVALLAGTAHNGQDVLRWQARQLAPTLPKPVKWLMKLLRQDLVRTQMKRLERIEASTEDVIRIQFVKLNAKWFREFMAFEPTQALRHATVPVLAITGRKDIQVDPADVSVMERAVPTPFTGHVVEDVTHLLRPDPGPASVRTYKKQARRPLDQRVADLLTDWVATSTRTENEASHDQV
jgi:alpha-beta hydrolase superfamily lysophospholipase